MKKCTYFSPIGFGSVICSKINKTVSMGVCKNCKIGNGEGEWLDEKRPFSKDINTKQGLGIENLLDGR